MSNTGNTPLTFLQEYSKVISDTIAKHKVRYTTTGEKPVGQNYCVDGEVGGKKAHVSTLKVVDPTHRTKTKYMLNVKIEQNGETITHRCSGNEAKRIHDELSLKYEEAISRTRLKKKFQNPAFANHIRGC